MELPMILGMLGGAVVVASAITAVWSKGTEQRKTFMIVAGALVFGVACFILGAEYKSGQATTHESAYPPSEKAEPRYGYPAPPAP